MRACSTSLTEFVELHVKESVPTTTTTKTVKTNTARRANRRSQPAPKPRRRRQRKQNRNQRSERGNIGSAYAQMVADPCNARLVPGIFGDNEGLLARTKTTQALAAQASGYILWFPTFHNKGATGNDSNGNLFIYTNDVSSLVPANDATNPFGRTVISGGDMLSSNASFDPAWALLSGTTAADARSISACARLIYTGKLVDASGEIAVIENLSLDSLLAASPDFLFTRSNHVARTSMDYNSVTWRGDTNNAEMFHTEAGLADRALTIGSGAASVVSTHAQAFGPRGFGLAWRGVAPGSSFSLEMIKNIEWRPTSTIGFEEVIPRGVGDGENHHPEIIAALDRASPSWSTTVGRELGQLASTAGSFALKGLANHAKRGLLGIMSSSFGAGPLPGLLL